MAIKNKKIANREKRIAELTRKYFWEQKAEEGGFIITSFFIILCIIGLCWVAGIFSLDNNFFCHSWYSVRLPEAYEKCINSQPLHGNAFTTLQIVFYGFGVMFILLLVIIAVIGILYCLKIWIDSNLNIATKRAIAEVDGNYGKRKTRINTK